MSVSKEDWTVDRLIRNCGEIWKHLNYFYSRVLIIKQNF